MTTALRPELEELLRDRATAAALAADMAGDREQATAADARRVALRSVGGPARRRWRRPAVGLGGLIAVGTGAVAVLLLSGGDPVNPLTEARAALGAPDEIIHFRIERYAYTGAHRHGPDCKISPTEVWQPTDDSSRLRTREQPVYGAGCGYFGTTADGVPRIGVVDDAYAGNVETQYVPALSHAVRVDFGSPSEMPSVDLSIAGVANGFQAVGGRNSDPQAALRGVLATPGIRIKGVSTQDGRLVRTFVVPEPPVPHDDPKRPRGGRVTYVVDAKTFAPLSITEVAAMPIVNASNPKLISYVQGTRVTRFASWERLPLDAAHEPLLSIQIPAGTKEVSGTAKDFFQVSGAVRARREREGTALVKAYRERTGATDCPSLREPCQSDG